MSKQRESAKDVEDESVVVLEPEVLDAPRATDSRTQDFAQRDSAQRMVFGMGQVKALRVKAGKWLLLALPVLLVLVTLIVVVSLVALTVRLLMPKSKKSRVAGGSTGVSTPSPSIWR